MFALFNTSPHFIHIIYAHHPFNIIFRKGGLLFLSQHTLGTPITVRRMAAPALPNILPSIPCLESSMSAQGCALGATHKFTYILVRIKHSAQKLVKL